VITVRNGRGFSSSPWGIGRRQCKSLDGYHLERTSRWMKWYEWGNQIHFVGLGGYRPSQMWQQQ